MCIIAHRGCTITTRGFALRIDREKKSLHQGIEPASLLPYQLCYSAPVKDSLFFLPLPDSCDHAEAVITCGGLAPKTHTAALHLS